MREVTRFYGGPNTGKTHLCHLLFVVLPSQYRALYIDTERTEKIQSLAIARGLDPKSILRNIQLAQPRDTERQESGIEEVFSLVKFNSRIRLLVVDSLMFHYRTEFAGRSGLSQRAHRLNIYMHKLRNLAQTNNIAVVITNQSTSNPRRI
jgi:DNA repair protein RadA